MIIQPIPADLQPTDADIEADVRETAARWAGRPDIAKTLARMKWKVEKQRADPDAFLVPFVSEVEEYNAYLGSATWRRIRQAKLDEAGGKCQGCGGRATQVHHRDYRPRVLRGEDPNALVALCKFCHEHVHSKLNAQAPSWQDQERRLFALLGIP